MAPTKSSSLVTTLSLSFPHCDSFHPPLEATSLDQKDAASFDHLMVLFQLFPFLLLEMSLHNTRQIPTPLTPGNNSQDWPDTSDTQLGQKHSAHSFQEQAKLSLSPLRAAHHQHTWFYIWLLALGLVLVFFFSFQRSTLLHPLKEPVFFRP